MVGCICMVCLNEKNKLFVLGLNAFDRALELLDMTIGDDRWRGRLKELTRLRELLIDAFLGGETYGSRLADFSQYFFDFALAARCNK